MEVGYIDSWEIRRKDLTHPSHSTVVIEKSSLIRWLDENGSPELVEKLEKEIEEILKSMTKVNLKRL